MFLAGCRKRRCVETKQTPNQVRFGSFETSRKALRHRARHARTKTNIPTTTTSTRTTTPPPPPPPLSPPPTASKNDSGHSIADAVASLLAPLHCYSLRYYSLRSTITRSATTRSTPLLLASHALTSNDRPQTMRVGRRPRRHPSPPPAPAASPSRRSDRPRKGQRRSRTPSR